jgi:hypothetical protein
MQTFFIVLHWFAGNTRIALYNPLDYTLEGTVSSGSMTLYYWKPK